MLSEFQEKKLTYLFHILDKNKDGILEKIDFTEIGNEIADSLKLDDPSEGRRSILTRTESFFTKLISNVPVAVSTVITLEEWMDFLNKEIVNGEDDILTDELVDLFISFLFSSFDQNRDGYTSIREYILMFSVFGIDKKDLTSSFMKFDVNGDCRLSRYELMSCIEAYLTSDNQREPGNWIFGPWDE